jgi:hypothetical protein
MTRQVPESLTSQPDLDDSAPHSNPLHPLNQHPSPQSFPISSLGLSAEEVHPFPGPSQLHRDMFGNLPQFSDGLFPPADHGVSSGMLQEDPLQMGHAQNHSPVGVSQFRGVSFSKGKWQAGVMSTGRCRPKPQLNVLDADLHSCWCMICERWLMHTSRSVNLVPGP